MLQMQSVIFVHCSPLRSSERELRLRSCVQTVKSVLKWPTNHLPFLLQTSISTARLIHRDWHPLLLEQSPLMVPGWKKKHFYLRNNWKEYDIIAL